MKIEKLAKYVFPGQNSREADAGIIAVINRLLP